MFSQKVLQKKDTNNWLSLSNVQIYEKTKVTIKDYERRLKEFFDFNEFETTELSIEVRCYIFAVKSKINLNRH